MPLKSNNMAVSRTLLVAAIAGGLWALAAPGAGLANPGMGGMGGGEDHHRPPQTQPRPQGGGGCGGCGGGGGGSRPSADELRDARDRAGRAAQGDGDLGDSVSFGSSGRSSQDLTGQIAATAAADQESFIGPRLPSDVDAGQQSIDLAKWQADAQAASTAARLAQEAWDKAIRTGDKTDMIAATTAARQAEEAESIAFHGRTAVPTAAQSAKDAADLAKWQSDAQAASTSARLAQDAWDKAVRTGDRNDMNSATTAAKLAEDAEAKLKQGVSSAH